MTSRVITAATPLFFAVLLHGSEIEPNAARRMVREGLPDNQKMTRLPG
jgi:hypothetical protein